MTRVEHMDIDYPPIWPQVVGWLKRYFRPRHTKQPKGEGPYRRAERKILMSEQEGPEKDEWRVYHRLGQLSAISGSMREASISAMYELGVEQTKGKVPAWKDIDTHLRQEILDGIVDYSKTHKRLSQ